MAPAAIAPDSWTEHSAPRSGAEAAPASPRRTPLRLVPSRRRRDAESTPGRGAGRTRLLTSISVTVVVGALLAVVVAQAMLANGQVSLASLQHELTLEQGTHRQAELAVAQLETPSRIVSAATGTLGMVRSDVIELPYVSLSVPLPTPTVTMAPVTVPASSSPSTTTTTSSSTSTTTSTSTP
jgi:hypothetical protein